MVKSKKSPLESLETEIIHEAEDFIKGKLKRRIIKYGEVSILFLLSMILIVIGVSELIATYFPLLAGGWSYLLLGVFFLLFAIALKI